jgi:hypothetical protein
MGPLKFQNQQKYDIEVEESYLMYTALLFSSGVTTFGSLE